MPKAYERSEVKKAAAVFRSAFASHQPLARLVGERGGGAALFAKKSDLINTNNFVEFRRSERVESTKSLKDSNDSVESSEKMDCHAKPLACLAMTKTGRHFYTFAESRNDDIVAIPRNLSRIAIQNNKSVKITKSQS